MIFGFEWYWWLAIIAAFVFVVWLFAKMGILGDAMCEWADDGFLFIDFGGCFASGDSGGGDSGHSDGGSSGGDSSCGGSGSCGGGSSCSSCGGGGD